MNKIFDIKALVHKRNNVGLTKSNQNHFLLKYIYENIQQRFETFGASFNDIMLVGAMSDELVYFLQSKAKKKFLLCDSSKKLLAQYPDCESSLIKDEIIKSEYKFDFIYSFLDLHHINNLKEYLQSIRACLNKNGIFMACFFGEENLKDLRYIFLNENTVKSMPRFFPYIDIKSAATILSKSGFAEPIADLDKISISYRNISRLCNDIKDIAETNILSSRCDHLFDKNFLQKIEKQLLKNKKEFEIEVQLINVTCYLDN